MGSKSVVLPAMVVIAMVLMFAASAQARPYGDALPDIAHEDGVLINQSDDGAFDLNQAGATLPVSQEVTAGFALDGERPAVLTSDANAGLSAHF
ncbi:unnamed protein product [Miscanthus lutarioriparius]|uniref:Uncharacterized protein n=1 Tax=Miscanthus lutarioriparius TaxID=422564 RepID=A0A811RA18_9POAL|nr:unnamed protein product [Miscanthus lutarioriparius]